MPRPCSTVPFRTNFPVRAGRFFSPLSEVLSQTPSPPSSNGFVYSAMRAYSKHHRLVIRPDDVWLAILTQFSLFVNANAESLRHAFVQHKGKKALRVVAVGTRYTVDFGGMARQMTTLIQENVVDQNLTTWIVPNFTTTTDNDKVVASAVMMATLKEYFSYQFGLDCGLPAVTLLGNGTRFQSRLE